MVLLFTGEGCLFKTILSLFMHLFGDLVHRIGIPSLKV
jgi:hypothetical protein